LHPIFVIDSCYLLASIRRGSSSFQKCARCLFNAKTMARLASCCILVHAAFSVASCHSSIAFDNSSFVVIDQAEQQSSFFFPAKHVVVAILFSAFQNFPSSHKLSFSHTFPSYRSSSGPITCSGIKIPPELWIVAGRKNQKRL
jgi:hypothetical protein